MTERLYISGLEIWFLRIALALLTVFSIYLYFSRPTATETAQIYLQVLESESAVESTAPVKETMPTASTPAAQTSPSSPNEDNDKCKIWWKVPGRPCI